MASGAFPASARRLQQQRSPPQKAAGSIQLRRVTDNGAAMRSWGALAEGAGRGEVRGLQVRRRRLEAREAQSSPRALPATRISPPPPLLLVIPFDQPQSAIKDSPGSMRSARHGARRSLSSRRPPADLAAPMQTRAGKSNRARGSLRLHGLQATHDTPSTKTPQAGGSPRRLLLCPRPSREMQALRMCGEDLKRRSLIPRGWGKNLFQKAIGGGRERRKGTAEPIPFSQTSSPPAVY